VFQDGSIETVSVGHSERVLSSPVPRGGGRGRLSGDPVRGGSVGPLPRRRAASRRTTRARTGPFLLRRVRRRGARSFLGVRNPCSRRSSPVRASCVRAVGRSFPQTVPALSRGSQGEGRRLPLRVASGKGAVCGRSGRREGGPPDAVVPGRVSPPHDGPCRLAPSRRAGGSPAVRHRRAAVDDGAPDPVRAAPRRPPPTGRVACACDRAPNGLRFRSFPSRRFRALLTPFSGSFSSFPRGTCTLSAFRTCLALDGSYRPRLGCVPGQPDSSKAQTDSPAFRQDPATAKTPGGGVLLPDVGSPPSSPAGGTPRRASERTARAPRARGNLEQDSRLLWCSFPGDLGPGPPRTTDLRYATTPGARGRVRSRREGALRIPGLSSSRFTRSYWGNPFRFPFLRRMICLNPAGGLLKSILRKTG